MNERLAEDNRFDPTDVFAAFDALGRRPEELRRVLKAVALSEDRSVSLGDLLADNAAALRHDNMQRFEVAFSSIEPLQKAVLIRIIEQGQKFSPFSADSMAMYAKATGGETLNVSAVQRALTALRERDLVWQPARGNYAIEDIDMVEWFNARQTAEAQQAIALPAPIYDAARAIRLIVKSALDGDRIEDVTGFVACNFPDLSDDGVVALAAEIEDALNDLGGDVPNSWGLDQTDIVRYASIRNRGALAP